MTAPPIEAISPEKIIGHIQTDTFCEHCGYNLHTQVVTRDERLGILICRCTECGRWTAAGKQSTAGNVWLNRFGTMMLTGWVLFLLFVFALSTLFLLLVAFGHMKEQTYFHVAHQWNPVTQRMDDVYRYALEPDPQFSRFHNFNSTEERHGRAMSLLLVRLGSASLASIVGGMSAVFLWHVKRIWRIWALAIPLLACAIAVWIFLNNPMAADLHGWAIKQTLLILVIDAVALLIGITTGRPIARLILRLFVPPKPRQHLAFLWTTDQKHLAV